MVRKIMIALAAVIFAGAVPASMTEDARMGGGGGGFHGGGFHGGMGGGGFRGGMGGGGFRGGMGGGGFRGAAVGGGFRGGAIGGGFRGAAVGGGFRSAAIGGGFRSPAFRGGFVGARSFAVRPGFAPRVNRFAFARLRGFGHRRFAFAAVPFVAGVGLYGGSCWSWQPTPWGWQRVWGCDYDYGYY